MAQPMKIEARLDDTNSRGESSSYSYAWWSVRSYSMSYFQRDETQGGGLELCGHARRGKSSGK